MRHHPQLMGEAGDFVVETSPRGTGADADNEFARAFARTLAERPGAPFLWLPADEAPQLIDMPGRPGALHILGSSEHSIGSPSVEQAEHDAARAASPSSVTPAPPCGEGAGFRTVAASSLVSLSYAQVNDLACRLAAGLATHGVHAGDLVPVDLANSPLLVALVLAASRAGFALVTLNTRLSAAEKRLRIEGLETALGRALPNPLRADDLSALLRELNSPDVHPGASGVAAPGQATAVVMFTSGTTGAPKAVPLSWDNLCGSAHASNARLAQPGKGLWQATLPMYHVGGLQILVRSVLNATPLALYGRFDATRVLADAVELHATHLSVVDKTLQDLLDADESRACSGLPRVLPAYECLLLGGSAPNPATLRRAVGAGARVWASFGMTETSSNVANAPVTSEFDGWLDVLDGYEARIVRGEDGALARGQLAVAGPGVTAGYLNAPTPRTPDGLLLTGDVAEVSGARIRVGERTGDMFVSGGENVYPAEIENALRELPGVRDAYVFGAPDPTWGRRPVAFVEASASQGEKTRPHVHGDGDDCPAQDRPAQGKALDGSSREVPCDRATPCPVNACLSAGPAPLRADCLRDAAGATLSRLNRPERLYVLDELPRTGIGKVDRAALRDRDAVRLEVARVDLWRIEQPLVTPFVTARTTMRTRESILLRVTDRMGRVGLGECVSFPTSWYLPETLGPDLAALCEHLIPLALGRALLDPWQAEELLASCPEARELPMARAALENALWDLWARIRGLPLWSVLREQADTPGALAHGDPVASALRVPAGVVVGIGSVEDTLAAVARAFQSGYTRVKLKVRPGDDVERVRVVRLAYPDLMLTLDANQSYTEADLPTLRTLDELGIRCIEEPLDPLHAPSAIQVGSSDLYERLGRLQGELRMAVCLDESMTCAADAWHALRDHLTLRCFALKIGKFGGVGPALRFYREARAQGAEVWLGGMYETSVSKRLHAAFEALPGIEIPGDLSATSRYFAQDVATPELTVERGSIELNPAGYETGLGCDLDEAALARVCLEHRVVEA